MAEGRLKQVCVVAVLGYIPQDVDEASGIALGVKEQGWKPLHPDPVAARPSVTILAVLETGKGRPAQHSGGVRHSSFAIIRMDQGCRGLPDQVDRIIPHATHGRRDIDDLTVQPNNDDEVIDLLSHQSKKVMMLVNGVQSRGLAATKLRSGRPWT